MTCCIPNCKSVFKKNNGIKLYSFPGKPHEKEKRDLWIRATKIVRENNKACWQPQKSTRICSSHFVGGKKSMHPQNPAYIPSIFSPDAKELHSNEKMNQRIKRFERSQKRSMNKKHVEVKEKKKKTEVIKKLMEQINCENDNQEMLCAKKADKSVQATIIQEKGEKCFVFSCTFENGNVSTQCNLYYESPLQYPKFTTANIAQKEIYANEYFRYSKIKTDEQCSALTGVSRQVFELLVKLCPDTKSRKIIKEDRILIFLIKMKTGLCFNGIASFVGLRATSVSRIFFDVLPSLTVKTKNFIFWPDRYDLRATMPSCFKVNYPDCTAIIDCTEIKTEQPLTVEQRVLMFSQYKQSYTVKFLIVIAPSGQIIKISKCYGGRSSDAFITNDSGFLQHVKPFDVILADKGFPGIKTTLEENNSILVVPPFLHDGHLTEDEVDDPYRVASVRIHVERCIQRVKIYRILHKLPIDLVPYANEIIHMCCVSVNLQNPIIK